MSLPEKVGLRSRKRVAMREAISDAATRLFNERGFDEVTMDDVAETADVGRKTVFNYFPRKEDLFFDRSEELRQIVRVTVEDGEFGISPIEACRLLAHKLVAERSPYVEFSKGSKLFLETITASAALKARARELRDDLTGVLADSLCTRVGQDQADPDAYLAAHLIMAAWTAARIRALETFARKRSKTSAEAIFLELIDKGCKGAEAAMAGTPYARSGASVSSAGKSRVL